MNSNKNNEQETVDFSSDICSELAKKKKNLFGLKSLEASAFDPC